MSSDQLWTINDIGLSILQQLSSHDALPRNILISPVSIVIAMAMLAGTAGPEQREKLCARIAAQDLNKLNEMITQLMAFLQGGVADVVNTANAVFLNGNLPIKPSYIQYLQAFSAEVQAFPSLVDAVEVINAWISKQTLSMIPNMLTKENLRGVDVALVNAIAFKAQWQDPFDKTYTAANHPFHKPQFHTSTVSMMFRYNFSLMVADHDTCTVFRLPFARPPNSPAIFLEVYLPTMTLVSDLATSFYQTVLQLRSNPPSFASIEVGKLGLPKFKFTYSVNLTDTLSAVGFALHGGFPELWAIPNPIAMRDTVLHEACIEVDEEGAKAAAVTAVLGMFGSSAPPPPKRAIIVDRPFVFAVTDGRGLDLFLGWFWG